MTYRGYIIHMMELYCYVCYHGRIFRFEKLGHATAFIDNLKIGLPAMLALKNI